MNRKRVAILVSGSGTNMENIARNVLAGALDCEIAVVVCDHPAAPAIERARRLGLEVFVIERKDFGSREEFDKRISEELTKRKVDAIFLAGFMRILTSEFVKAWKWRILNIHPSLLPKYPGTHAIKEAFRAGEKESGVTVHFVDEGVDTGPIILQRKVPIQAKDSLEGFEKRIHAVEYELYPEAIRLFLAGKLIVEGNKVKIVQYG